MFAIEMLNKKPLIIRTIFLRRKKSILVNILDF